jgi:hypothetical protein
MRTPYALQILLGTLLVTTGATVETARADGTLLDDDTWNYRSRCDLAVDGGVVVGFPAALPTGLATGIGGGFTRGRGLAWGARASWGNATESSEAWTVTHDDVRLRVTGALRHTAGRGTIGLRLGVGGTLVHERRVRNQGMRAGLDGEDLATAATALYPAADLDVVVTLHIAGPWLLVASGGPSLTFALDDERRRIHGGWTSQLGVAWQP